MSLQTIFRSELLIDRFQAQNYKKMLFLLVPSGLGENRLQAYGWSLPATYSSESMESGGKNLISVPVPVYCRPLNINEPGMKVTNAVDQLQTKFQNVKIS